MGYDFLRSYSTSSVAATGGTVARTAADRAADIGNARDFGAVGDGVTDDSAAIQAALAVHRVVLLPVGGCTGPYLINTTVTVPASKSIIGQAHGSSINALVGSIKTTAAVDTFRTTGGAVTFEKLAIVHSGTAGSAIKNNVGTLVKILSCYVSGTNAAATDPLIYVSGSNPVIRDCYVYNNRASTAWAIDYDRIAATGLNIEGYVESNQFSGTGAGMIVHTSDGSGRPEGVHINRNTFFSKGAYQLLVNAVLSMDLIGNTFDVALARAVVFDPIAEGIQSVSITANWFANEGGGGAYRIGLELTNEYNVANSTASGILGVSITANKFNFCLDGIRILNSAAGVSIIGNQFSSISQYCININQAYRIAVVGNVAQNLNGGNYMAIADGILGGPFVVIGNVFSGGISGGAGLVITATTRTKFQIGFNPGVNYEGIYQTTRVSLTTAGTTILGLIDKVQFVQPSTIASATVTLTAGVYNGQTLHIHNYAGPVTALTFSPSVTGWTDGATLNAYSGLSLIWDSTLAAWVKVAIQ